jgi:hypothetical protein
VDALAFFCFRTLDLLDGLAQRDRLTPFEVLAAGVLVAFGFSAKKSVVEAVDDMDRDFLHPETFAGFQSAKTGDQKSLHGDDDEVQQAELLDALLQRLDVADHFPVTFADLDLVDRNAGGPHGEHDAFRGRFWGRGRVAVLLGRRRWVFFSGTRHVVRLPGVIGRSVIWI